MNFQRKVFFAIFLTSSVILGFSLTWTHFILTDRMSKSYQDTYSSLAESIIQSIQDNLLACPLNLPH